MTIFLARSIFHGTVGVDRLCHLALSRVRVPDSTDLWLLAAT
jgi:hypothetical protein